MALGVSLLATEAARHKDDGGTDEKEDARDENQPDAGAPVCSAGGGVVVIDVPLDDAEADKVADEGDEGDDKGEQRDDGGQEGADDAGAGAEQERDEGEAGGDGVQDHDPRQDLGRVGRRGAEVGAVETFNHTRRVVADPGGAALVSSSPATHANQGDLVPLLIPLFFFTCDKEGEET